MAEPLSRRLRTHAAAWVFAIFLLAAAALTGAWFVGADLVRDNVAETARAIAGEGGTFQAGSVTVRGFPLDYETEIRDVRMTGSGARGPWEWRADRVVVNLSPWADTDATFELAGHHQIKFRAGRVPLNLEAEADSAPGEIRRAHDGRPAMLRIAPANLTVRDVTTGRILTAETMSAQIFHYPGTRSETEPAAGLILDLGGVTLPDDADLPLGRRIDRLTGEVQVLANLPLPVERRTLARWRERGGSMEIKALDMVWGPAAIEGSGTVTLDEALQPEAAFALTVRGFDEMIDALAASGTIQKRAADGAKLVLGFMARRSSPGGPAELRVPVTIQDRTLSLGPARLLRLPQMKW